LKKIVLFIILILVFTLLYYFFYIDKKSKNLDGFASGNGRSQTTQIDISSKFSGRLQEINVQEGDLVEKNQLLAKIEVKELESKLQEAIAHKNQAVENRKFAHNEWHPAQPMAVAIHRSEDRRQVRIAQEDRPSRAATLHMGFDGMTVKVCRWYDRDCAVLAGTNRDYNRGHSSHIRVPDLVDGTLSCSFPGADDSRRYRR
jgi:multidrug resistance efflux pump